MKVALYARVSSDAQDTDLSLSAQLRALREYAQRKGYEVVREFIDEAESGRSGNRPAFKEMIALGKVKEPPFEAILVWKLNRFTRSRVDSITYKALLRSKGIEVISINEPFDDSPTGRLMEGVIESIDEFYSANLGQDIKRGLRENARRGFFNGSKPPYGFHKVPVRDGTKIRSRLEPDPEGSASVKVVRRIFDLALNDAGCKDIARILNREGIRTSTGSYWGKTTVHKVLTNEAYAGTLVWGGRPGHPAIRSGEPPVRVEGAWEPIIDKETFNMVKEKMAQRKPEVVHPRVVPSFYLLSGLLYCSCGMAMIGRSAKSHRYYYYMCNRSFKQGRDSCRARILPKDKLEGLVIKQIKERILTEECLEGLVRLVNEELDSSHNIYKERLDTVDAEHSEVRMRLSRLYDALETGKVTLDDLSPRIRELRVRQDELNKARVQLEAEAVLKDSEPIDIGKVKGYVEDLKCLLEEGDLIQSKAFLRSFIKRIEVDGDQVRIDYRLPLPAIGGDREVSEVLPIGTLGGPKGTIPRTLNKRRKGSAWSPRIFSATFPWPPGKEEIKTCQYFPILN
ncbi:MAG: recombinase family protein [Dehalococcoidales bacterium]|nr:recombinase family protein [Dehalococcoidales bacterium]